MTDEEVMMDISDGDIAKASILFDRYSKRIYNFFIQMTYDRSLSEDLTQNVFERIIRYRKSYDGMEEFKPWIFQIARNTRIDFYKRKKVKEVIQFDSDSAYKDNSFDDLMNQNELRDKIQMALMHMKSDQREILIMTRYQEMKYVEVAKILQISEANVKVKVHRAIKDLRYFYFKIDKQ